MNTIFRKRKFSAKLLLLILLTFSTLFSFAGGATNKMKDLISSQFNSFEGIYIMGGIIVGSLLVYVISNYLMKDKESKNPTPTVPTHHHHHHRRHHRVVKKTS
jgi:hypothetical protein